MIGNCGCEGCAKKLCPVRVKGCLGIACSECNYYYTRPDCFVEKDQIITMNFKPQLALDLSKVNVKKLTWPMWVSQKIDGVWCCAIKAYNKIAIFSRTGERFVSMRHIETELNKILYNNEAVVFEAAVMDNITPQSVISGWVRDTKQQHEQLYAACHTLLFLYGYNLTPISDTFYDTWYELSRRINSTKINRRIVTFIMQHKVQSLAEAQAFADCVIQHGGEGAVLRNPRAIYQPGKRNADIIKIKKGVSFDLKVLGVYEGKGKYEGTLGGLICQWKNGKTIEISGMTDAQRTAWWNNPVEIIGKVVQVDAMCESFKGKLREPRFKGIREDKTEGDF